MNDAVASGAPESGHDQHRPPSAGSGGPAAAAPTGRRAHAGPPADERPESAEEPDPRPAETGGAGRRAERLRLRLRLRPRSVRAKIVSVLMVPVVSLMALWAFAAVTTAQDVSALLRERHVDAEVRSPVAATVAALQAERRAAARHLASPADARATALQQLAAETDRAVSALRLGPGHTVADGTGLPRDIGGRVRDLVAGVTALRPLRSRVAAQDISLDETLRRYDSVVARALAVDAALASAPYDRVLLDVERATEQLAREDALLSAAELGGGLSRGGRRELTGAALSRRLLLQAAAPDLRGAQRAAWDDLTRSGAYTGLRAAEDRLLAAGPVSTAVPGTWEASAEPVLHRLRALTTGVRGDTDPVTRGVLTRAGAAVMLGLLAVIASLVVSVNIGRGLVTELVSLRNSALELARRQLPAAMRRLRAGEEIDLEAEAPRRRYGGDEIGQVGEALGTVQRAALQAAVERAELLSGVSGVFVNLARRSQVLVHRQLALLDSMERRTEDPGELEDLFKLDHLTTRMRRHAEGLIILSGAAPGRAWRKPVPLTNVVRAAVAEVEDYARVEVRPLPQASVAGGSVADLTHLIAELVENATQFSPPHTKVRVYGEQVGNGYALEIEDRGLGMGKEAMEAANRRIAQAQALDLFDSDRLGLFVVSRLSRRQGVKVSLRPSSYGGTTAVVLLPTALLEATALEAGASRAAAARAKPPGQTAPPGEISPSPAPLHDGATRPGEPVPRTMATGATPQHAPDGPDIPRHSGAAPPQLATARTRGGADGGLPRRVRRASLAPQLREAPVPAPAGHDVGPPGDDRSPEDVRATMSAYHSGWIRGGGADARDASPPFTARQQPGHAHRTPTATDAASTAPVREFRRTSAPGEGDLG